MPTIPEKAAETLEVLKNPAEQLSLAIDKAKETIHASRTITGELGTTVNAAIDIPKESIKTPLKSVGKLVSGHPIDAMTELASGATNVMGDMVKLATAAPRIGAASLSTAKKGLIATSKFPFQGLVMVAESPFRIFHTMEDGVDKFFSAGKSALSAANSKLGKIMDAGKKAA